MTSYLAEKYAEMLTEDDVTNLFDILTTELGGNRSEAARQAGLTGKATYDWTQVAYVKRGTKKKVLDAALRANFATTVEYLLEQSTDRNIDLLRTILGTFYANALEAKSSADFKAMQTKFQMIRKSHIGLIRDGIQKEVADMEILLKNRAEQLGVSIEIKTAEEISGKELLEAIEIIGNVYVENPMQAEELAVKNIGLPLETVKPIMETFRNLCTVNKLQTDTLEPSLKHPKTHLSAVSPSPLFDISQHLQKCFSQEGTILRSQMDEKLIGGNYTELTTSA